MIKQDYVEKELTLLELLFGKLRLPMATRKPPEQTMKTVQNNLQQFVTEACK